MYSFIKNQAELHIIPFFPISQIFMSKSIFIIMKIIVNESQFKKIVGVGNVPSEVLIEQIAAANPMNHTFVLQQKINDILGDEKKLTSILNDVSIGIELTGSDEYALHFGNKKYQMRRVRPGNHALVIPKGKSIAGGEIPMSLVMPEIEKLSEYKEYVEQNPNIKAQLERQPISAELHAGDTGEQSYFHFEVIGPDSARLTRQHKKSAVSITQPYPLGEFFERQPIILQFPKQYGDFYGILSVSDVESDISQITLTAPMGGGVENKQSYLSPERFVFSGLGDVFNFGDVTFRNEEAVNQELQAYISKLKGFIDKYGQPFIEYVKSQNPMVYGYSSRDGAPDEQIQGKYQPCSGNKTRSEYDMCLSTERARIIADVLNQGLPELGGAFKYKGVGETDKWGPAWTPENAETITPEDTSPNRRYLVSPFKKPFYPQKTK